MFPASRSRHSGSMLSNTLAAVLLYGIVTHYSAGCSPAAGKYYPANRFEDTVGSFLLPLGEERLAPPEEVFSVLYPQEERTQRHADGMFNKAYRKALGQLSARKYLHSLMAKRVGGGNSMDASEEEESLSKRHSDGMFTDSYSRHRKQMAVKKYLAAVLGKSLEDLDYDQALREVDFAALRLAVGGWLGPLSGEPSTQSSDEWYA
ncbi:hypothetical protein CRUP_020043 [Coryphaenoides rupestris]|nr:hypothetical protein CRUP_020043 [Coryphaenoides rupestris]